MHVKQYRNVLPEEALALRLAVFVSEQGFEDAPEAQDATATHLVAFSEDGRALATCRYFPESQDTFLLSRFAVSKESRALGIGRCLLFAAEEYMKQDGARRVLIHSQAHAAGFYSRCGYSPFGDPDTAQGRPHLWLEKTLG